MLFRKGGLPLVREEAAVAENSRSCRPYSRYVGPGPRIEMGEAGRLLCRERRGGRADQRGHRGSGIPSTVVLDRDGK